MRDERAALSLLLARRDLEKVSRDALRHRRERRRGDLVPQRVHGVGDLAEQGVRDLRIIRREFSQRLRFETQPCRIGERLHVQRGGTPVSGDHAERVALPRVAHGDLTPIGPSEVRAEESAHDQRRTRLATRAIRRRAGGHLLGYGTREEPFECALGQLREKASRNGLAYVLVDAASLAASPDDAHPS